MTILYTFFSQLLTDFIFQSDQLSKEKSRGNTKAFLKHGIILIFTMLPLFLLTGFKYISSVLLFIMSISLIHILLDFLKYKIDCISKKSFSQRYAYKIEAVMFVADQILHIVSILILSSRFSFVSHFNNIINIGNFTIFSLKIVLIILYVSLSGAYVVPLILKIVYGDTEKIIKTLNDSNESRTLESSKASHRIDEFNNEVKTGKYIGIMERMLILIFLSGNYMTSIGFVIAVKSLTRFKLLENKAFSEYYLLGTLSSVLYAFIAYAFLNVIL